MPEPEEILSCPCGGTIEVVNGSGRCPDCGQDVFYTTKSSGQVGPFHIETLYPKTEISGTPAPEDEIGRGKGWFYTVDDD